MSNKRGIMTLRIGITGGIGTGKTAASNIFAELGIPVFNADKEAKWLMNSDKKLKKELINILGEQAYKDNELNRPYIANKIFSDNSLKTEMEAIVHPAVRDHFMQWYTMQKAPYIIKEAALIYETKDHENLDYVIVVDAPEHTRIERVKHRDNSTTEAIRSRIQNQINQSEKVKYADFVLNNEQDLEFLRAQVLILDKKIRSL